MPDCLRHTRTFLTPLFSATLLLGVASTAGAADPTGSMSLGRTDPMAARLPDGRVLVAGGYTGSGPSTANVEIYDASTGSFAAAAPLVTARSESGVTTLSDGRILVVGGKRQTTTGGEFLRSAEIYDPASASWSVTPGLMTGNTSSVSPITLTLPDGKVIVITSTNSQVFDPATGVFSQAINHGSWRGRASAAVLPDGRVLLAGGQDDTNAFVASAVIWNPATDTWSATGSMATARTAATATRLADGRILIAGGHNSAGKQGSVELYDPATQTFSPTGPLVTPRSSHVAVALADGGVLVSSGVSNSSVISSLERYDATTGTWSNAGTLNAARWRGYTATRLTDGNVLFAGGYGAVASAEIYAAGGGNVPPIANFSYAASNLTVTFTDAASDVDGTIASHLWNFGDGTTSAAMSPVKTYAGFGTYLVTLSVTDNAGATNSVTKSLTVGTAPNAAPTANFSSITNGLTAMFTDGSSDSDGSIAARAWNFGDGTTSSATNPSKTYAAAGTYSVSLTVTDNGGATNSITKSLTVAAPPNVAPTANFSALTSGLVATFTDGSSDSDGSIVARAWNFGDGTTSGATNPSKTYAAAGTYSVSLTVTDNRGATHTKTSPVTVVAGGCSGTVLCNGIAVTGLSAATGTTTATYTLVLPAGATNLRFVTSGGTGDADLYVKFGSAPTTSSYNCRPYINGNAETCNIGNAQAGTYYVVLRAYSAFSGVSLTGSYTTGANVVPVASFSSTTSGPTVNFIDSSSDADGSIVARNWNFGDGTTSTSTNPSKTYATSGTYSVSLTVTDNAGATHTKTSSVTVASGGCGGTVLCNGIAATGIAAGSGQTSATYTLVVPAGATNLQFTTSGGSGDADMYIKFGSAPTTSSFDCAPHANGNNEACTLGNIQAGTYYVVLRAFTAFSGVSLMGSYTTP